MDANSSSTSSQNGPSGKAGRLAGALDGFLGTLTSRNTDYQGYWLGGLVESRLDGLEIDLLATPPATEDAFGAAARIASHRFREQIARAGLDWERIVRARLQVAFEGELTTRRFNGSTFEGHVAKFVASASLDTLRILTRYTRVFVAPHSQDREMRSVR